MEKEQSSLEDLILEEMLSDLSKRDEFSTEIIDDIKGLIADNKFIDSNALVAALKMKEDPNEID